MPTIDPNPFAGLPNPFADLAGAAANAATQAWISVMLVLWNMGLWFLRTVLNFMDAFLTPDITEGGPGAEVYKVTFWIGGTLMLILALCQLGVAAIRRDGKSLAQLLIGVFQFTMVWVAVLAYAGTVIAAASGLTTAFMESLLKVNKWNQAQFFTPFETKDIANGVLATILGVMGIFLVIAAIGHFFIMVTRAGAIIILVATAPIAAAGLVGNLGHSWFWKTMRWFHAAAFTPPLIVLVMGIGIQFTTGVATGGSGLEGSIGTALPGVLLICGSVVSPVALFKLFSFVDPGTATGAAVRQGLAAEGGLQGLLQGRGAVGSSAASATTGQGRSAGEASAEDLQMNRLKGAVGGGSGNAGRSGGMGGALGAVGGALAAGIGVMSGIGQAATSIGSDLTNQMGVGANTYYPDMGGRGGSSRGPVFGSGGRVVDPGSGDGGTGGGGGEDSGSDGGSGGGDAPRAGQPNVVSASAPANGGPGGPSFTRRRGGGSSGSSAAADSGGESTVTLPSPVQGTAGPSTGSPTAGSSAGAATSSPASPVGVADSVAVTSAQPTVSSGPAGGSASGASGASGAAAEAPALAASGVEAAEIAVVAL